MPFTIYKVQFRVFPKSFQTQSRQDTKFFLEHEKHEINENAPCGAWGFQENSRRWPENLFQKSKFIIIRNYVTVGLKVEEVGGRRESQSPKAHSLGHRPR